MAAEKLPGPCAVLVIDSGLASAWHKIYSSYLLRIMRFMQEKLYAQTSVSWSAVVMHPESPLVNNPVTAGPWISTTQMSSDLPALLSSQDSKGKGKAVPTGRDVPILDGLVAAIELMAESAAPHEPLHIFLITGSDTLTVDGLAQDFLESQACRYNTHEQFDGFGFRDVQSELRLREIHLSLIATQWLPNIESFQQECAGSQVTHPLLQQFLPPISTEHFVSLIGFSDAINKLRRSASDNTSPQAKRVKTEHTPSSSAASTSMPGQPTSASGTASMPGLSQGIMSSGDLLPASTAAGQSGPAGLPPTSLPAQQPSTSQQPQHQQAPAQQQASQAPPSVQNMSLAELQKAKNDLNSTIRRMTEGLQMQVKSGKMQPADAKRAYETLVKKGAGQLQTIDGLINVRQQQQQQQTGGRPAQGSAAAPQSYSAQSQNQTLPPPGWNLPSQGQLQTAAPAQPQPSQGQQQPQQNTQQQLWSGPLVHRRNGQAKDAVTFIAIHQSTRSQPSEFAGVPWPSRLEFSKTMPLESLALQKFVQQTGVPVVNVMPVPADTLLMTRRVQERQHALMLESTYQQFSMALAQNKTVAFIQLGTSQRTGILLMASGTSGRMAGLLFWRVPLPDHLAGMSARVPPQQATQQWMSY